MVYFTSICANYLPKAISLAQSIKEHCRDATFVLCLVEREIDPVARDCPYFDRIILASEIGWENFDTFIFRHTIVEASTAVKPRFMLHLMEQLPGADKFIYLDPDILVYSHFSELERVLDEKSIVLAPHLLRPGNIEMEISSLVHGTYNLGFLGIRRDKNAVDFLKWWEERLFHYCYDDKSRGIFTDQKWVDLAPCFFDVHILKHHGYDFATWSLLGSDLRVTDGHYVINGDRLRFIHFSGIDSLTIDRVIKRWLTPDNSGVFIDLYQKYKNLLVANGEKNLSKIPWSYGRYDNGEPIKKKARIAYRNQEVWKLLPSPFSSNNVSIIKAAKSVDSFSSSAQSMLRQLAISTRENGLHGTLKTIFNKLKA